MSNQWIALIVAVCVAVGIMVVVGGGDAPCGTPTTKPCGPGERPPQQTPPHPYYPR